MKAPLVASKVSGRPAPIGPSLRRNGDATATVAAREFIKREVAPHHDRWEEQRLVDRAAWQAAGAAGIIGLAIPEEYDGAGGHDYRYRMILVDELSAIAATSFATSVAVQDDLVLPYLLDLATEEQKERWLAGMAAGDTIGAIAMTEPRRGQRPPGHPHDRDPRR